MGQSRRLTQLREEIERLARYPSPPHVIGLSGGADSAVLAWATPGQTRCLHIHHGLPASDDLAAAAMAISDRLGLKIEVIEIEVPSGPSPEAMAREGRYQAFASGVDESESLLLGHTKNDQAETVLLNLLRGAGTRGLAGMPYHRPPNIYRPLLEVSRSDTREAAALIGLPYLDDPTNADLSLTRNLLRLRILPLMEDLNPMLIDGLVRMADHLRLDADYLDQVAESVAGWRDLDEGVARVPIGVLATADRPIRMRLLSSMVSAMRSAPTTAELERMEAVVLGNAAAAELEGGIRIERSGPFLSCSQAR